MFRLSQWIQQGSFLEQTQQIIKGRKDYWYICQLGQSGAATHLCICVLRRGEESERVREEREKQSDTRLTHID